MNKKVIAAEENTLVCQITGEQKKASDQETTLQSIIRSLTAEYGFPISAMQRDFSLSYEDPDSGKKRRLSIDLVVFDESQTHEPENIIRVCVIQTSKTKASDKTKGIYNLELALGILSGEMTAENSGCQFGLWTNGIELHFMQKRYDDLYPDPIFEELADFPGKGESIDDLDRPDRQMLRIAAGDSLLKTFQRCHDYIYGNQGRLKTAFWELLHIIFCKIYDERRKDICRHTGETYRRKFWVGVKERNTPDGQTQIANRIHDLFKHVKKADEFKDVFSGNEEITLNDRVLSYLASEIGRYSFLEASVDTKGMAYESIVSNTLKQERGQFFTPRNIVKLMVSMLNPTEKQRVLDVACGSGGFLVVVLEHVRLKIARELHPNQSETVIRFIANTDPTVIERARAYAKKNIFGIDFDPDLKRAARMNMVMNGDGHGNILCMNSLLYPKSPDSDAKAFDNILREQAAEYKQTYDVALGTFDLIFTNPPFGSKIPIDDPDILTQFELGHRWKKDDNGQWINKGELQISQPPEILFIERCVQFLKEGGQMAIVLPDGILGNPDLEYVRYWILQNTKVLASIDLPVEAFLPQVGVQASLLFLQKKTYQERLKVEQPDYDVFMAIAEKVGKDRRGNPIYVRDEDGAELIFELEETDVRLKDGNYTAVTRTIYDKEVDDDLPRILKKWLAFLKGEEL